jgi:hypothetical protein
VFSIGPVAIRLHPNTIRLAYIATLATTVLMALAIGIRMGGIGWLDESGDPWNYLAAGERLNAGHPLYELSEGDREVILQPPYWSVPLLAPPPIAVAWRPLAVLGPPSMVLWGVLGLVGIVGTVIYLLSIGRVLVVAILIASFTMTAVAGNFSALLLPGLILIWIHRHRRGREVDAGRVAPLVGAQREVAHCGGHVGGRRRDRGSEPDRCWTGGLLRVAEGRSIFGAIPDIHCGDHQSSDRSGRRVVAPADPDHAAP